jgi:hypothetical protein
MEQSPDAPRTEPDERDESDERDQLDLTSIGLAVFFVSLIVVVGALLILPAVF